MHCQTVCNFRTIHMYVMFPLILRGTQYMMVLISFHHYKYIEYLLYIYLIVIKCHLRNFHMIMRICINFKWMLFTWNSLLKIYMNFILTTMHKWFMWNSHSNFHMYFIIKRDSCKIHVKRFTWISVFTGNAWEKLIWKWDIFTLPIFLS